MWAGLFFNLFKSFNVALRGQIVLLNLHRFVGRTGFIWTCPIKDLCSKLCVTEHVSLINPLVFRNLWNVFIKAWFGFRWFQELRVKNLFSLVVFYPSPRLISILIKVSLKFLGFKGCYFLFFLVWFWPDSPINTKLLCCCCLPVGLTSCPAPFLIFIQSGEKDRVPGCGELTADGGADAGEGALQHAQPSQRPVAKQPHQAVNHWERRVQEQQLLIGPALGGGGV